MTKKWPIYFFIYIRFATLEVMHQYGLLLQDFETNGEYVNDCIFTMMHHVGGDLNRINVLFQPNILNVFLKIWQSGFEICEVIYLFDFSFIFVCIFILIIILLLFKDWSDLLDYVINSFMKNPKPSSKLSDSECCEPKHQNSPRHNSGSERLKNW